MIRPRGLATALAPVVLTAVTTLATAQPASAARRLRVDIACAAAVDRAPLLAALAIELAGTGWVLAGGGADASVAIDAAPCTSDAALELAFDAGPAGAQRIGPVALPPAARARGLALLIAETLSDLPAPVAPTSALFFGDPPGLTAPAAGPSALTAVAQPPIGPAPDPRAGTQIALTAVRRWYLLHPDQVATGARLTASHAALTRWLRVALDVGADHIDTPFHYYEMFAGRGGLQLGVQLPVTRRLTIELGGRSELAAAYATPATNYLITPSWLYSSSAGAILAATLDVSPSISARVELELTGILWADSAMLGYVPPSQPSPYGDPHNQQAFSRSIAFSLGLAIR
jgi:hypothetical protein